MKLKRKRKRRRRRIYIIYPLSPRMMTFNNMRRREWEAMDWNWNCVCVCFVIWASQKTGGWRTTITKLLINNNNHCNPTITTRLSSPLLFSRVTRYLFHSQKFKLISIVFYDLLWSTFSLKINTLFNYFNKKIYILLIFIWLQI